MAGPDGLALQLGQIDADVLNLAPDADHVLQGGYDLRVHSAEVHLDAASLARFLAARVPGARDVSATFAAPDQLTLAGKLDGRPFRATGRLGVSGGRLAFTPTRLEAPTQGVNADVAPQTGRVAATITDEELARRLAPAFKAAGLSNTTFSLRPAGEVDLTGRLAIDGRAGTLALTSRIAPSPDGKLDVIPSKVRLDWDGLRLDADPSTGQAHLQAATAAIDAWLARGMPKSDVRDVHVQFQSGGRFTATLQAKSHGEWRPVSLAGKLDAADGALRVTPDHVVATGLVGGVDVDVNPAAGRGTATVSENALNAMLAPLAAKNGLERAHVRLLDGNRFELVAQRRDEGGAVKPLLIRGRIELAGPDTVRIVPEHLEDGGQVLDMDGFAAGVLHLFGWHLDHEVHLNTAAAAMDGDTLVVHPSRLPKPAAALLDHLEVHRGRLVASGRFLATARDLWPHAGHVELHGNTALIHPADIDKHLAGRISGVRTGDGTLSLDSHIAPADWQRMVSFKGTGVDFRGDRARIDLAGLAGLDGARVVSTTTANGEATVELRGNPSRLVDVAPTLPGLTREGTAWVLETEKLGLPLAGPVTGVKADAGGVTIDIGEPGPATPGAGVVGRLSGRMAIAGVTVEDAVVGVDVPAAKGPIALAELPKAHLRIERGRATIPSARVQGLLDQALPADRLAGYRVKWAGDGLGVQGRFWGLGVQGKLLPSAGGPRGLALAGTGFRWGIFPVPARLATWLVARQLGVPYAGGRAYVDAGKMADVTLGPVTGLKVRPDAVQVTIG